jgi:hypothetical protein
MNSTVLYIYYTLASILTTLDPNRATRFKPELPHALTRLDQVEPRVVLDLGIFIGPLD